MASSSKSVEMTTPPTSATSVTTFGPAGTLLNLRESGANILETFCNSYPDTEIHSLLPNLFENSITELMEPRENLSRREEDQFRGRLINQVGEGHELVVFDIFVRLIRQKNISPTLLIMRTFEMDTKNPMNMKRMALESLLPNINLKSVNTQAENDFLVLVQNVGVICIEAKGSTKDSMVRSAEKQLTNMNKIVQSIMKAMTKDKKRIMPTVRLIIVPDCTDTTPDDPTTQGSFFVFKDMCDTFEDKWEKVINELNRIKSENPLTSEEYRELSQILVGLWSAKAVCVTQPGAGPYELKQDETSFLHARQLEKIDEIVDTSDIRNESHFKSQGEKLNPFTAICRTNESDIFRSCNNLKLCYLTPDQKQLFSHQNQAIVRSPAGCGKSLLILFKTLELVSDSKLSCAILILAPVPHTIRVKNALQSNNIPVNVIEQFPPSSTSCRVFIMDVEKFFKVERTTLMSYDMSGYHLFVDDLQKLEFDDNKQYGGTSFYDVGDFINQTYSTSVECGRYLWVMMDLVQGWLKDDDDDDDDDDGKYSQDLFLTHDNKPQTYNIPTVTLLHVMRNTHHIIKLTNEARNAYVNLYNVPSLTNLPSPQEGHKVTSNTPVCHKLKSGTDKKHKGQFIVTRLREVLETVTKPPYSLPLSNVAVIYDDEFKPYKDEVVSFLLNEFGTTPQTIEQQLTNNNTADIIMDEEYNIMSFESPVVVYINVFGISQHYYYNICTRARVSLTVINVSSGPTYKNMDVVLWKPDGSGNFTVVDLGGTPYRC